MNGITDQMVSDANQMYQQWVTAIERNPAALRELTDKFFVCWQQYNEVSTKLDATPTDAIRAIYDSVPVNNWTRAPLKAIRQWLASLGKQVSL